MNKYIIFGCGGHARSVADVLLFNEPDANITFIDSNAREGETIYNFPVLESYNITNEKVFVAIGDNIKRVQLLNKYKYNLVNIIAKDSYIGKDSSISSDAGIFIGHRAYIGPLCKIEKFSVINTNASIDHECTIGYGSTVAPNATLCGKVNIGNMVWVGASAAVKENLTITDNSIIGIGSIVVKNITKPGIYIGCPAKIVEKY